MKKHSTDAEQPSSPQEQPKSSTRRKILFGISATGVIALGGGAFALRNLRHSMTNFGAESQGEAKVPDDVLIWCEISADNRMTLFIPKTEMGQGIHTALAQIFADELGADWNTISVVQADTKRGFDPQRTMFSNGSTSVMSLYAPARKAAARLRLALATEAAQMLGVGVN
jgi:isoquinoline 1-oxidoreductase subunit beta